MLHIKIPERPQKEEKSKFSVKADNRQSHSYATAKTRRCAAPLSLYRRVLAPPPIPPTFNQKGAEHRTVGTACPVARFMLITSARSLAWLSCVRRFVSIYIYISHI